MEGVAHKQQDRQLKILKRKMLLFATIKICKVLLVLKVATWEYQDATIKNNNMLRRRKHTRATDSTQTTIRYIKNLLDSSHIGEAQIKKDFFQIN